ANLEAYRRPADSSKGAERGPARRVALRATLAGMNPLRSTLPVLLGSVFTACAGSPATPSESERPPLAAPAQPAPSDGAASAAPLGPSGPVFVPELRDAALADPQAFAFLKELCTTAPHRLAGSAGAARAVEWGRTTMQRIGFDDVRLEPCTVPR